MSKQIDVLLATYIVFLVKSFIIMNFSGLGKFLDKFKRKISKKEC